MQNKPCAAARADMVATSTAAEEDTPFPSGTVEETCMEFIQWFLLLQINTQQMKYTGNFKYI